MLIYPKDKVFSLNSDSSNWYLIKYTRELHHNVLMFMNYIYCLQENYDFSRRHPLNLLKDSLLTWQARGGYQLWQALGDWKVDERFIGNNGVFLLSLFSRFLIVGIIIQQKAWVCQNKLVLLQKSKLWIFYFAAVNLFLNSSILVSPQFIIGSTLSLKNLLETEFLFLPIKPGSNNDSYYYLKHMYVN